MRVDIVLSQDLAATCAGYRADVPYTLVSTFDVDANDVEAACEIAHSVCTSYPNDMHCPQRYWLAVRRYRRRRNRSLAVGDVVVVHGAQGTRHFFAVEASGFRELKAPVVCWPPRVFEASSA